MTFRLHPLPAAILLCSLSGVALADVALADAALDNNATTTQETLPTIVISAQPLQQTVASTTSSVAVLQQNQLMTGAATLGLALANEPGIHADTFGGGASRPIIRGQTSPRVQILSDGNAVMDASTISPDHAITVDPLLAEQVEVIRGPATLLYGGGAIGGVVNITDHKIPTQIPDNPIAGQLGLRADTSAQDKTAFVGLTVALGSSIAAHIEGLSRDADNYSAQPNNVKVPGTYTTSKSGSAGLSWIGDTGYTGIAFSRRHDEYGLAGDADEYAICAPDATGIKLFCDPSLAEPESADNNQNAYVHHGDTVSWVRLNSKRVDLRSEYDQPFAGFSHIKVRAGYTDYQHDEVEDGETATSFKNKGYDARVELTHQPIAGLNGVVGLQYSHSDFRADGAEAFLPQTITRNISAFFLEHYQWQDIRFELGARHEWRLVNPSSPLAKFSQASSDLNATSAAGSALWQFKPEYALVLSLAHSERLPNAQELYANGPHFATVTYETGNANLAKEKSNNIELGLRKTAGDATFKLSVYHNQISDYIYAKTLDQIDRFRLIEYSASDATFNGVEGEVNYRFNPVYSASILGDYVRAKLDDSSDNHVSNNLNNQPTTNRNISRIPGAKLGAKINAQWDALSGYVELTHQFKQSDIADFETSQSAYSLLNASLAYDGTINGSGKLPTDYRAYVQLNNLLNKAYTNHTSFLPDLPMQGRNLIAGVQFKF